MKCQLTYQRKLLVVYKQADIVLVNTCSANKHGFVQRIKLSETFGRLEKIVNRLIVVEIE